MEKQHWKHELKNLKVLQEDPHYGAVVPQLLGLPPLGDRRLQARLHPLILAQVKELGLQALFKVTNMATPTQTYSKIRKGVKEPYLQFIERLQGAMEKLIANVEFRNYLILQLQRVIKLLPDENPSLNYLINACAKVGSNAHNMTTSAESVAAAIKLHCYQM